MNRLGWRLAGGLLALVVPAAALLLAADRDRAALGLTVAPFGWPRLIVVHLLAALPFSLLLAAWLGERLPRGGRAAWTCMGLGLAFAALTVAYGADVGGTLDRQQAGFLGRLVVRVIWCAALQGPWCLLGDVLASRAGAGPLARLHGAVLVPVLAVAALLPAVYTDQVIQNQSRKAEDWLQRQRLVRAQAVVTGLCDLGSTRPVNDWSPDVLRREIGRTVRRLRSAIVQPLPATVLPQARLEQAQVLATLGRLDEAERILSKLDEADPGTLLLRAAVLQEAKRWEESSAFYRRALVLLQETDDPDTGAAQLQAYDALAVNARERQAYDEMTAVYAEALERLPAARAHIHFQLGRHHHDGGRPARALEHLETAARLDPAAYGARSRSLMDEIRQHTPGCLLPRH